MPWVLLAVCLGLCLSWQSGGLVGLMVERQCVERVEEGPRPVDETPASPLAHDAGRGREPRPPAPQSLEDALASEGERPVRRWHRERVLAAPAAGVSRLIMIGVSRI